MYVFMLWLLHIQIIEIFPFEPLNSKKELMKIYKMAMGINLRLPFVGQIKELAVQFS